MQHVVASDYQPPPGWRDEFLANPDRGVSRLIGGFVSLPRGALLGPSETARILLGRLPRSDALFVAFDKALAHWLEARQESPGPTEAAQLNRWLGETLEAFAIAGALQPAVSAKLLRTRFIRWREWAEQHFFFNRPDARLAYFDALARTQRLAAQSGLDAFALEPFWLQLCGQCGGKYPQTYLSTALLGLRLLPDRTGIPNERPWVTGIGTWALMQDPSTMDFAREWGALKRIYPLTPAGWQTAVAQTLERPQFLGLRQELRDWWGKDVGLDRRNRYRKSKYYLSAPRPEAVTTLLKKMHMPASLLEGDLRRAVAELEEHAKDTGDASPLAVAGSTLGLELLKRTPARSEVRRRGEIAVWLASVVLKWEPNNPFAWVLWRDALVAVGDQALAESIGWAAIKRFPEDVQMRNQLARVLVRNPRRHGEAEALLRETISRFPQDEYSRNQLAHLLIETRRRTEAEAVLKETRERYNNVVAANQLADLLGRRGKTREAEQLLREVIAQDPDSRDAAFIHSRNMLARLMSRNPDRDEETIRELRETIRLSEENSGSARNQLAFIFIRAGRAEEAQQMLLETLRRPTSTLTDRATAEEYLKALSARQLPNADGPWSLDDSLTGHEPENSAETTAPNAEIDYLAEADSVMSFFLPPEGMPDEKAAPGSSPSRDRSPNREGAESASSLYAEMAAVARQQGELRRLKTLLAGKEEAERHDIIDGLLQEAPAGLQTTYGDFIRRWVVGMEPETPVADSFALNFVNALRESNVDKLRELPESHRSLRRLSDMAQAVLTNDKAAAERTFSWLKRKAGPEPRAVIALRKLTLLRLDGPPNDPEGMLKALAQNDNVIADLEEAALAEADMLLAA